MPIISEQYFGFVPMATHKEACRWAGTNVWEVTKHEVCRRRTEEDGGDYTDTTIRMICRDCGVVQMDVGQINTWQSSNITAIGYGSKPLRRGGLWLHPGPARIMAESAQLGPETYYVTASDQAPRTLADAIGIVGWHREWRGSGWGPVRWLAGYGLTEYGSPAEDLGQKHKSLTAAVHRIADRHATELAAAVAPAQP